MRGTQTVPHAETADEAVQALRAGGFNAVVLEVQDPSEVQSLVSGICRLDDPPPVIVTGPRSNGDSQGNGELVAVEGIHNTKRLVPRSSILYGRALGDYVRIVCPDGRYLIKGRISDMESEWRRYGFVRTHRCYVVNTRHVREVRRHDNGTGTLLLSGGERIPVSRRLSPSVRAALRA